MKVNWFHLMPYRWLPEDFRECYRSVWVDIPSTLWDSRKGHHLYNEYLDELEFAEKMGVEQTRAATRAMFEFCVDWV
jgi:hypothetical protein